MRINKNTIIFLFILIFLVLILIKSLTEAKLEKINISGNNNVSTSQIAFYINPYKGKNIFLVPIPQIEQNITKNIPYIQQVFITKSLPSTLNVQVKEYKPLAIVNYKNKQYVINQNDLILTKFDHGAYVNLPLIESTLPLSQIPSSQIANIYQYLTEQGTEWSPTLFKYTTNGEIEIDYGNWSVTMLTTASIKDKFNNMKYIYTNLGPQKCPELDIRFSHILCSSPTTTNS